MAEKETEIPGVVPLKTSESPSLSLTSESLLRDLLATSLAQTNPTTAKPIDGKMTIACPLKMRLLVPNSKFLLVESSPKAPLKLLRI